MTVTSLDRIGVSAAGFSAPRGGPAPFARIGVAAAAATRVIFGTRDVGNAVYGDPRAKPGMTRLWSAPIGKDEAVSALMARNRDTGSSSLRDQWRGLGGALLTRFAETGGNYARTLVDDPGPAADDELAALSPDEQAQRAAGVVAARAATLAGVTTNAPSAGLTIRTRSGQSVELKIAVSAGSGRPAGIKVELKASGAMTAGERAAVAQLAGGLDRALEGLGGDDAVGLDLAGLMSYDRDAIVSVDLTATNTRPGQRLGAFSLHLGDDKQTVALQGAEGNIALSVDTRMPLGNLPALEREAAVQRTLDRMQSAGERGQANAALVAQMTSVFTRFQAAAAEGDDARQGRTAAGADADVASRSSGLADFDASFGGETFRTNRFGALREAGVADYHLSQETRTTDAGHDRRSTTQTVSERLSADFRKPATAGGSLDLVNGNYAATRIRDSSTVTTLIETLAGRVTGVLRKTDAQQLKTVSVFEHHHLTHRESEPWQRSVLERLR